MSLSYQSLTGVSELTIDSLNLESLTISTDAGLGKVLTSDSAGLATWEDPAENYQGLWSTLTTYDTDNQVRYENSSAVSKSVYQSPTPSRVQNGIYNELSTSMAFQYNGNVSALRFYKDATSNPASWVVSLWSAAGLLGSATLLLASATTGWNTVNITPVSVTAGVVYHVSYRPSAATPCVVITNNSFSEKDALVTQISGLACYYATVGQNPVTTGINAGQNYFTDVVYNYTVSSVIASLYRCLLPTTGDNPTTSAEWEVMLTGFSDGGAEYTSGMTTLAAATSLNTASTIVKRDASGNFAAGTITASLTGTATNTSNVSTKTAAQVVTSVDDTLGATNLNTASRIVKRDASGNFSAGTITAALTGNATTATSANGLRGITVSSTAPTNNQVLTYDSGLGQIIFKDDSHTFTDITCTSLTASSFVNTPSLISATGANQANFFTTNSTSLGGSGYRFLGARLIGGTTDVTDLSLQCYNQTVADALMSLRYERRVASIKLGTNSQEIHLIDGTNFPCFWVGQQGGGFSGSITSGSSISSTGNMSSGGTLSVTGTSAFTGNVTMSGSLTTAGAITATSANVNCGALYTTSNAQIGTNLDVLGTTNLTGATTLGTSTTTTGNITTANITTLNLNSINVPIYSTTITGSWVLFNTTPTKYARISRFYNMVSCFIEDIYLESTSTLNNVYLNANIPSWANPNTSNIMIDVGSCEIRDQTGAKDAGIVKLRYEVSIAAAWQFYIHRYAKDFTMNEYTGWQSFSVNWTVQ